MLWTIISSIFVIVVLVGIYHRYKPLKPYPKPVTTKVSIKDIAFYGNDIFNIITKAVKNAKELILIDVFMFNTHNVHNNKAPKIVANMNDKCRKYVVMDPSNTLYGTIDCQIIQKLKNGGVNVYELDIDRLQDNNMIYSPLWRTFLQPFGTKGISWAKNPVVNKRTTLRALLKALNFRANHRKVVVCDDTVIVTSMNLDNKSKAYDNSGICITSKELANTAIDHAQHLLDISKIKARIPHLKHTKSNITNKKNDTNEKVTLLTGEYIKKYLLKDIVQAKKEIKIAMLFISDADILQGLKDAKKRGVKVRFYLDNNTISFNNKKKGFPNKILASELAKIGDLYFSKKSRAELHDKIVYIDSEKPIVYCGSANLTRRSLLGTNPETMVKVEFSKQNVVTKKIIKHFKTFSVREYDKEKDKSTIFKLIVTKIMEKTGTATF